MSEPTPCPHCGRPMLPGPILACHTPGCPNNLGSALGEQSLIADLRAERDAALRVNAEQGERLRTAQARVKKLEEERARLSKTTDGVVPGFEDTLYLLYRQPSGLMVFASDHQDFRDFHSPDKPTHWVGIYSTREAAEYAKGEAR